MPFQIHLIKKSKIAFLTVQMLLPLEQLMELMTLLIQLHSKNNVNPIS